MDTEPKLCQGKDVFERMNYLYQAGHLMASRNRVAASYYGNIMISCSKKSVLRIDPEIKRTVCKSCQTPLIPGETARVRICKKPSKNIKWTCLTCFDSKKYPVKTGHKLWSEQPESIIQIYNYTPKLKETDYSPTDGKKESSSEVTLTSAGSSETQDYL